MDYRFNQFFSIARLTALEASRQPIFLLVTTIVLVFIALLPVLITHIVGDSARMVRDSALALQLVAGLVLACYAATATINRELRKGTLASVISKPISREQFFLAKFAGVAAVMIVFVLVATAATMMSVRTASYAFTYDWAGSGPLMAAVFIAYILAAIYNFISRTPFVSRAFLFLTISVAVAFVVSCAIPGEDQGAGFGGAMPWNILPAGALIGLATALMCTMAVSLAVHLDMVPTSFICLGIFLLGMMSDYLFGARAATDAWAAMWYALLPNWQHFWAVDALHQGLIPWLYTLNAAAYAIFYGATVLSAGLLAFRNMEVK